MYHAPVNVDLDHPEAEPTELPDDGVVSDVSSSRLREAHLHNGQAQTRALFAPFFSITAAGGALLVAWAMFGGVRLEDLVLITDDGAEVLTDFPYSLDT